LRLISAASARHKSAPLEMRGAFFWRGRRIADAARLAAATSMVKLAWLAGGLLGEQRIRLPTGLKLLVDAKIIPLPFLFAFALTNMLASAA